MHKNNTFFLIWNLCTHNTFISNLITSNVYINNYYKRVVSFRNVRMCTCIYGAQKMSNTIFYSNLHLYCVIYS